MSISSYESRIARIFSSDKEVFNFISDIRNFERFVRNDIITDWQADKRSCNFRVPTLGNINLYVTDTKPDSRIAFSGTILNSNPFSLYFLISGISDNSAEVKVTLDADLNPVLKMMAEKPICQFLETLVNEMEKFNGWRDIKV